MKIIAVDNFDREIYPDRLICENINPHWGEIIVKFLNNRYSGNESSDYFKLVEDSCKLFEGFRG